MYCSSVENVIEKKEIRRAILSIKRKGNFGFVEEKDLILFGFNQKQLDFFYQTRFLVKINSFVIIKKCFDVLPKRLKKYIMISKFKNSMERPIHGKLLAWCYYLLQSKEGFKVSRSPIPYPQFGLINLRLSSHSSCSFYAYEEERCLVEVYPYLSLKDRKKILKASFLRTRPWSRRRWLKKVKAYEKLLNIEIDNLDEIIAKYTGKAYVPNKFTKLFPVQDRGKNLNSKIEDYSSKNITRDKMYSARRLYRRIERFALGDETKKAQLLNLLEQPYFGTNDLKKIGVDIKKFLDKPPFRDVDRVSKGIYRGKNAPKLNGEWGEVAMGYLPNYPCAVFYGRTALEVHGILKTQKPPYTLASTKIIQNRRGFIFRRFKDCEFEKIEIDYGNWVLNVFSIKRTMVEVLNIMEIKKVRKIYVDYYNARNLDPFEDLELFFIANKLTISLFNILKCFDKTLTRKRYNTIYRDFRKKNKF